MVRPDESSLNEFLSVSFLIDARAEQVAKALDAAFLHGQPGQLDAATLAGIPSDEEFAQVEEPAALQGWDMEYKRDYMLPVPYPVAPEWVQFAHRRTKQVDPKEIWYGSFLTSVHSWSLGLRPLRSGERVVVHAGGRNLEVELLNGRSTWIRLMNDGGAEGQQDDAVRHFLFHTRFGIDHHTGERIYFSPDAGEHPEPDLILAVECRPAQDTRRTELVRRIFDVGWILRVDPQRVRIKNFTLDFETRAWLDCHSFPMVEVWRGLRRPEPHAFTSVGNIIISCNLCAGHAAAADSEVWPLFNETNLHSFAEFVPKKIPIQRNFIDIDRSLVEGNIDVESFALLLDRVLRRASVGEPCGYSDVLLEKFVDLGSGRGLAVLAAHLLFPFRSVLGIEIVGEVNDSAKALASSYEQHGFAAKAEGPNPTESLFMLADALEVDWSDATLVFVNNVTWPHSVVHALASQALRLRRGAVVLSAQRFPCEPEVLQGFDCRGEACVNGWVGSALLVWAYRRL